MNKISDKLNVQLLAETLKAFQIDHLVLSPGSRNGALTMQFVNDPYFTTYSVVDERSAAFVALGIAQQKQQPVVICCTSGSAIANYYPAITEAFYQNIPIVVISADRPEHLVDNFDGQTIRQKDFLKQHTVHSVQLSEQDDTETLTKNMLLIKYALIDCLHKQGLHSYQYTVLRAALRFSRRISYCYRYHNYSSERSRRNRLLALHQTMEYSQQKISSGGYASRRRCL